MTCGFCTKYFLGVFSIHNRTHSPGVNISVVPNCKEEYIAVVAFFFAFLPSSHIVVVVKGDGEENIRLALSLSHRCDPQSARSFRPFLPLLWPI